MSENLFSILRRHGVTVAAHQRGEAARAALEAAPRPPAPLEDLADLTPAQLAQHLVSVTAFYQLVSAKHHGGESIDVQRSRLIAQLNDETRTAVRAEADEIISQLRPAFDLAADAARHVIALGVKPTATAEDMLDATDAQRTAWREFRATHAPALDSILDARIRLSRAYGIAPVPDVGAVVDLDRVNWGATVLATDSPYGLAERDPRAPHVRWLAVANQLHMPLPSELPATLDGTGLSATEIVSEARRRAAAGYGTDETTLDGTAGVLDAHKPVWIADDNDTDDN